MTRKRRFWQEADIGFEDAYVAVGYLDGNHENTLSFHDPGNGELTPEVEFWLGSDVLVDEVNTGRRSTIEELVEWDRSGRVNWEKGGKLLLIREYQRRSKYLGAPKPTKKKGSEAFRLSDGSIPWQYHLGNGLFFASPAVMTVLLLFTPAAYTMISLVGGLLAFVMGCVFIELAGRRGESDFIDNMVPSSQLPGE